VVANGKDLALGIKGNKGDLLTVQNELQYIAEPTVQNKYRNNSCQYVVSMKCLRQTSPIMTYLSLKLLTKGKTTRFLVGFTSGKSQSQVPS
jgi:hypothetical protein